MFKKILKIALCAFAITLTCAFAGLTAFGVKYEYKVDKQLQACYTTKVYRGILLENWDTVDSKTKLTAYQLVRESFVQDMKPTMDALMSAIKKAVADNKGAGLGAVYRRIAIDMCNYKRSVYGNTLPVIKSYNDTNLDDWVFLSDMYSLPLYHWTSVTYRGTKAEEIKLSEGEVAPVRYLNFMVNNTWYSIPTGAANEDIPLDFLSHIRAAVIEALNEYSYSVYELKAYPDKLTAISDSTKLGDKENLSLQYYVNPLTGVFKVNYIDGKEVKSISSVYGYVSRYYTSKEGVLAYKSSIVDKDLDIKTSLKGSSKYDTGYAFPALNSLNSTGTLAMYSRIPWLTQGYYTAKMTEYAAIKYSDGTIKDIETNYAEFRLRMNPTYLEWLVGHIYSGWEKGGLYDITNSSSLEDLSFVAPFRRLDSSVSSGNVFVSTIVPVTYINKWHATAKSGIYSYIEGSDLHTGLGTAGILKAENKAVKSHVNLVAGWRYNAHLQTSSNMINAQDDVNNLSFLNNALTGTKTVSSVDYSLNLDNIYFSDDNGEHTLYYNLSTGKYCTANVAGFVGLANNNVNCYWYNDGKYVDGKYVKGDNLWNDAKYAQKQQKVYLATTNSIKTIPIPVAVKDTMYYYNDIELDSVGNLQLMQINYVCGADELPDFQVSKDKNNVLVRYPTVRTVAVVTEYLEAIMYDKEADGDSFSFNWSGIPVATGRTLTFNFDHLDSIDMFSGNQAVVYNKIAATEAVGSQYSQTKITLSNATAQDIIYQAQATHQGILLMAGVGSYNNSGLLNWLQTDYANEYMSKYVTKTGITANEMYNKLTSKGISLDIGNKSDLLSRYMEIEQELSSQTQYGVVRIIFSAVAFVGVLVLVYSVLLVIAYFLDIFNAFSDISILSLITFGGCRAVTNIKDIERLGLPVDKKHKYVSLRGIIIRWCTCTLLGIALLSATQIYAWITLLYRYLSGFFGI